jgi:hypothetical protein
MVERTYPVTVNGMQYEVRASSPQEAAERARGIDASTTPRIIAREGSTRVFERPNGQRYVVSPGFSSTDPERVQQALSGMTGGEISRQSIDEGIIAQAPFAARAGEVARGIPFIGSYLDEALGAVRGPEAAASARMATGAMQRQRPGETMALNIGGGLASAGLAAAAAPARAAGLLSNIVGQGSRASQVARGAGAGLLGGGVEGGIYGFGEGTDMPSRVSEAATGAGFGGAISAIAGGATPLIEAGVRNVTGLIRRSDIAQIASTFGISPNAARVIKNTFEMGGDMNAAMQRLQQAGSEGMLADAGEAAQALLDATAASGPAGAAAARGPIEERMARVGERLETGLTQQLGEPAEGPVTAVSEIMERTREDRSNLYNQAYRQPIDYAAPQGRDIESILQTRIEPNVLNQAIQEANAEMRDRGMVNQQIMAQVGDDGQIRFVEMPNVQQLDELTKSLNALARNARNTEGLVPVETPQSIRYRRQAQDLRQAVIDATGGDESPYRAAVQAGGDTIQERNAYELGERLLSPRTRVEEVNLELGRNPSAAQIEAAQRGLRTRIDQVVGDVRRIPSDPNIDARQALATLREMSSDNARAKISRLMGPRAQELFNMLDEAMVAAETRAAMSVNSRTAMRQATKENVAEMTAPGVVGQALRGDPINTSRQLIQAVTGYTDEFSAQQRQRIYQDIARALTEARGPNAQIALRALDAAMAGQRLTEEQTDILARLVAGSITGGVAPTAGRETATQFNQ